MDRNQPLTSVLIFFLFLMALWAAQYAEHQNSPTAPTIVQPAPEIEALWEIEDTRYESDVPLVTYLENNGAPLGYDAKSNTFYCTLGLDSGSDWPDILLTAPRAEGVAICFSDDYTYDWCDQAISEGYSYELLAYTDKEYHYFNLVFSGLPIVSLYSGDSIGTEYTPIYSSVSSAQHTPVKSLAKAHLRGCSSMSSDKPSFRLEFHTISQNGKDKKDSISVLGMPADSDWLLIANPTDPTRLRNHLAWTLWRLWNSEQDAFSLLQSQMVEVFVNDEYMGLYQLMQRIDSDAEIARMGGDIRTDCAFRTTKPGSERDRLIMDYKDTIDAHLRIQKAPQNFTEEGAFRIIESYSEIANVRETMLDDDTFTLKAESCLDVPGIINYFLFSSAVSLWQDNVCNNLYIWALKEQDGYRYTYSPWDMDRSFLPERAQFFQDMPLVDYPDGICLDLMVPCRLLALDVSNSRQILWSIWSEKRSTILSDDAVFQLFSDAEDLVNHSGAYVRESRRWHGNGEPLNISDVSGYAINHLNAVDRFMRESWPYGEYTPEGKPTVMIQ